jgi:hypothetical protein
MKTNNLLKLLATALTIATTTWAQTIWDGTADSTWFTSNRDATSYTINTAEELAGLAAIVNRGTGFYNVTITLGADIILNDTSAQGGWQTWGNANNADLREWDPIGRNLANGFFGYF